MHHHIDLRVQGGGMVVFCAPVGHNKILVAPLTAQNIGDKVAVAARVDTVELIVTRHQGQRVAICHGSFETAQVDFPQGALRE